MAIEDLISVFPVWNISSSLHSNIVCVCVCVYCRGFPPPFPRVLLSHRGQPNSNMVHVS